MDGNPLLRIGAQDDEDIDLADAALELALLDKPGLGLADYRAHMADLRQVGASLGHDLVVPHEQAMLLSYLLHKRHGYQGDSEHYDDPANANLIDVIDRKRGLPVALSILYLQTALALGWSACGLNMPGHFLIRIGEGEAAVIQDPFDGGRQLTKSDVEALVRRAQGPEATLEEEHVEPLSHRAILVRLLNNQSSRAERAGDLERAVELTARMTMIAPAFTGLWWERANLEQALGRYRAARGSLIAMLETTRSSVIHRQVQQTLQELSRLIN